MSDETKAAPTRSLVRKLAEVMGAVERVEKTGFNKFHKYSYATEADIVEAVRAEMAKRSVMMFSDCGEPEWRTVQTNNGSQIVCTMKVTFTFEDGDTGETRAFHVYGEGQDALDKATYKAFTGAEKYALLKTFLIPTGDDPEKDNKAETGEADAAEHVPTVPFGRTKGMPITDIDDADLAWQMKAAAESVADPTKSKWKAKNSAWLQALEKEKARREKPSPPLGEQMAATKGARSAPSQASAREGQRATKDAPQSTPYEQIKLLALKADVQGTSLAKLIEGTTGKTKQGQLTQDDVGRVEQALIDLKAGQGVAP